MGMTLSSRLTWAMISVFFLLPGVIIWGDLPPDSNLILHYQFEGDVLDSSANGNDGTLYGSPSFETGVLGQALVLDGDNDWIDIDDNVLSDFHDRTICLWAKKNAEHTGYLFATVASE